MHAFCSRIPAKPHVSETVISEARRQRSNTQFERSERSGSSYGAKHSRHQADWLKYCDPESAIALQPLLSCLNDGLGITIFVASSEGLLGARELPLKLLFA